MIWFLVWGLLVTIFVAAWTLIGRRMAAGVPIVPLAPRRPVPWSGPDMIRVAAVYIGSYLLFARAATVVVVPWAPAILRTDQTEDIANLRDENNPAGLAVSLLSGMSANVAAAVFALFWMRSRNGADLRDLGWRPDAWRDDIRLGLIAFAAVAAPVYGLQGLLSQFVEERHPIIEVLGRQPSAALYVLAGLSAVIVAPPAEEFFFRVLLQGWLESARPPVDSPEEVTVPADAQPRATAIVVSSSLFAALHIGQGAAPVPLFFLALALGYLYQRTHRLLPCATVHFCLNASTFALLPLSL